MAETSNNPNLPYIELEAPEHLVPGQNFYDQTPFAQTAADIAKSNGRSVDEIRKIISHLATFTPKLLKEKIDLTHLLRIYQIQGSLGRPIRELTAIQQRRIIADTAEKLQVYPFWYEYVFFLRESMYQYDGNERKNYKRMSTQEEPSSYVAWVSKKIAAENRFKSLGIEEVFPQDFAGISPTHAPTPQGMKPENRRWRILKAAEIVRDKR